MLTCTCKNDTLKYKSNFFKLTTGGDIACLAVPETISFSLTNRMTTYGIFFMSSARELIFSITPAKSLIADPATKTTDDLVGAIMPCVPRSRWRGLELLREIWWEGRWPGNLRGENTFIVETITMRKSGNSSNLVRGHYPEKSGQLL